MNVRLELFEQDSAFVGIINTRGFNQNTVYGCDYVVSGTTQGSKLKLRQKALRRGVAMSNEDCLWFRELDLTIQKTGIGEQVSGRWIWMNEEGDAFTAQKTQDSASEITRDEIAAYVEETYRIYEEKNVLLAPSDRLNNKVATLPIDSSDIILDFSSAVPSVHDSIAILFNGEPIADFHDLNKKPLRIRLKALPVGNNEVIVISQSVTQNKLNVLVEIRYRGNSQQFTLHPGFTRNEVLFLQREEE